MQKRFISRVSFNNGAYYETGVFNKKRHEELIKQDCASKRSIPKCDTGYLHLHHRKSEGHHIVALTYDELAAIALICNETAYKLMPRGKRTK